MKELKDWYSNWCSDWKVERFLNSEFRNEDNDKMIVAMLWRIAKALEKK
jgi:hypothetical protein